MVGKGRVEWTRVAVRGTAEARERGGEERVCEGVDGEFYRRDRLR